MEFFSGSRLNYRERERRREVLKCLGWEKKVKEWLLLRDFANLSHFSISIFPSLFG